MDQRTQRVRARKSAGAARTQRNRGAAGPAGLLGAMDALSISEPVTLPSPEADSIPPPPEALSAFVQLLERARYPSPRLPAWWLATAIKRFDRLCAYCGRDTGDAPDLDVVIHPVAGGPQRPDAAVLTCKGCKQARRRRDLLLWKPDASTRLHDMRAELALDSWNHLSRDPAAMRTPEKATHVIRARWQHPRFHCHGALLPMGGFIGWRAETQVPTTIQMRLAFDHGGWRLRQSVKHANRRNNTAAIFWIPGQSAAVDVLWDVIEHNGLVHRADLGDVPLLAEAVGTDSAHDWALLFPTVADLVRRRWREQR